MKHSRGEIGRIRGRVPNQKYLNEIKELLGDLPRDRDLLVEHLHKVQDRYHCISSYHIQALANEMNLPTAEIYEVATFYHHFDVTKEKEPSPAELTIRVCESLTCEMFGAKKLLKDLDALTGDDIRVQAVPCVGRCHAAPVSIVGTNPVEHATTALIEEAINNNQTDIEVASYIDYAEYCEQDGYSTLLSCINGLHQQDDVIAALEDSNLRGLGGAGFPVGRKWRILRDQAKPKLIAINIDEGEPGTFKDRHYLEQDPHRFIEGALIAHWAINADDIYIYLRDEYAGCRKILEKEIKALQKNPPCALPAIHLRRGAGAYICGEESAMIESIEGKRGMPRLRPPYVAEVGLFGRPTLEHNMESLHWVRDIIEKGAEWFTSHGRRERKGLRSFSVSGRIRNPGVHLAPAGITINELIDEFCGGMLEGHEFYGYFPGGASSGMLPASLGNEPLDFDTLQPHGSFIGSAAIIVLSTQDSAKELALNAMRFFEHESCGQCTPCRVGTTKAVKLMSKKDWDLPLLEELANVMEEASICGLGQAAPNPLRNAIKYFPEEFK
ncbi:MAG: NADH-quinone oxidoreductase subunit F [Gammaproteobacteria bacterium]|jgi:formate dehydrogenase beta subunit|nr:NADH-quinone oxidoreductase subunit F [Gammaproteobacteria bacterium]